MTSFLIKVVLCPLIVTFMSYALPNVDYTSIWQPVTVGVVIAVLGVLMEYIVLKRGTLWISTFLDFVAALVVVYFVSNVFPGAYVTFSGAILVALAVGVVEHFTHGWLITTARAVK